MSSTVSRSARSTIPTRTPDGPGDPGGQRIGLTAAGIQAEATGRGPEPVIGEVLLALADGSVSLRLIGGVVLGKLRPGARVELRLVGEADGSRGSLRRAGKRSAWR